MDTGLERVIDRRNKRLVTLITKLKMGIHILNFPEKPMFYSPDYTVEYSGYVKNFNVILQTKPHDGDTIIEFKLDDALVNDDDAVARLSWVFLDWIENATHRRCWVVKVRNTNLLLSGYNHHDKLNRRRAYPVFSEFNPHLFYEQERALEIISKFSNRNVELYTY